MNPSKLKNYRWKEIPNPDKQKIKILAQEIQTTDLIAKLLIQRGINNYDEARKYFAPSFKDLHNPFLMMGMDLAVNRIIDAINKKETCMIYGDYDVDGTNGTALLYLFFRELGLNVSFYIPDRINEGYGISKIGIDEAKKRGVKLLIAVDCGIRDVEKIEYANQIGIESIICDHHEPGEILPPAISILDPLQKDCNYPFKFLCGCGVAFKLIQGIHQKLNSNINLEQYLDFVAVAISADIVQMTGENKTFSALGINLLKKSPRPGYKQLMENANIDRNKLDSTKIVFGLAPRINAAGRLGSATRAVELLISDTNVDSINLADTLEKENINRKKIQDDTFAEALSLYENNPNLQNGNVIVLYNENWHPGVIGIVASKLVEEYYLPTIILTNNNGVAKGSCRSISEVSIYEALQNASNLLNQFGGHQMAAGLSIEISKIDLLRNTLSEYFQNNILPDQRIPTQIVDSEISLDEINSTFLKSIFRFAPYGPGNMPPTFVSKNISFSNYKLLKEKHFKGSIRTKERFLDCIAFDNIELFELARKGNYFDILFTIDENNYNDRILPQLKIRAFKLILIPIF